jgi:uncharacterized membrane protein YdbT with pleckstrin-like domain
MPTPPLQPTPHLTRLLLPEEHIIYTAKLHPLAGWHWVLGGLLLLVLGIWLKPLWLGAAVFLLVYYVPRKNFEMAVTTHRLLLRRGRWHVQLEAIMGENIANWQVLQSLPQRMGHAGTVTLHVHEGKSIRTLDLHWLWHPLTLIEALETLQLPQAKSADA